MQNNKESKPEVKLQVISVVSVLVITGSFILLFIHTIYNKGMSDYILGGIISTINTVASGIIGYKFAEGNNKKDDNHLNDINSDENSLENT